MSRHIPFQDLNRLHKSIRDELNLAYEEVLARSAFIGGDGSLFEEEFCAAHGALGAAGCGSGTDALSLAMRALGVQPGDEVILPSMTFIATAEAVLHVGATPVIVDVDPQMLLIDPVAVEAARTDRTRAVIPVHLFGTPVGFDQIELWRSSGLCVIEDAAQAHLAHDGGRFVGSAGDAACFSFYPGKNLGALGDGGAVISHDTAVLDRVRVLRDHGRSSKYLHDEIGFCSRLDGLQASFLRAKLRHLERWTDARRALAARYKERLGSLLIPWKDGSVHHLLVVRVAETAGRRDVIRQALADAGVATGVHYPVALSKQPSVRQFATSCPVAEGAADEILSLPLDPLMTAAEVDEVCSCLEAALAKGA